LKFLHKFAKNTQINSSGSMWKYGRSDMTKLRVAFSNFVKASTNEIICP